MRKNTGWYGLCLVAVLLMLTGCPKKPTETAEATGGKVTPPSGVTPPSESPMIDEPEIGETEIAGQGQRIASLNTVYFNYDRSDIREDMKSVLRDNAAWILDNSSVNVQIEGHCDERGTNDYNLALGSRRAESIKRYFVALGVPAARLSTISYGEEQPICRESRESCWGKNRRGQFAEAN